jgi:hypothetical protein
MYKEQLVSLYETLTNDKTTDVFNIFQVQAEKYIYIGELTRNEDKFELRIEKKVWREINNTQLYYKTNRLILKDSILYEQINKELIPVELDKRVYLTFINQSSKYEIKNRIPEEVVRHIKSMLDDIRFNDMLSE